jgi:hypothetical protein
MKMRIVEEIDQNGTAKYFPERMILWFWWRYNTNAERDYLNYTPRSFSTCADARHWLRQQSPTVTRKIHKF